MKKRKKYGKVLLTFVLVVALFTVQGLQIAANVTTPKPDLSNPTVTVNNGDQFVEAIQNAQDGDVIGLAGSCISIEFLNNYNLNSAKNYNEDSIFSSNRPYILDFLFCIH